MYDSIIQHYSTLLEQNGDSIASIQVSSEREQFIRFNHLLAPFNIFQSRRYSFVDYGSGTAMLADYLLAIGYGMSDYIGIDVVPAFVELGRRKHPCYKFYELHEVADAPFNADYVFASGTFNLLLDGKPENNWEAVEDFVRWANKCATKGFSFNMLSTYVDYFRNDILFYMDPSDCLRIVRHVVGKEPLITLDNAYRLRDGICPFEYTISVIF